MGNRQGKAPFDVRVNMRLYHQYVRDVVREKRRRGCDKDEDDKDLENLKRTLFASQFGREITDDDEAKLVWFRVSDGKVPLVVTSTSPTLREIERILIPKAHNFVEDDAWLVRVRVLAKVGDSPIEERMVAEDFYEAVADGDRLLWEVDRMRCCYCCHCLM